MNPRLSVILLAHWFALLIVLIIAAALVLTPRARTLTIEQDSLSIHLSADRAMIFAQGDCVTVEWHVAGIREVYFAGEPTIGDGLQRVCLTTPMTPPLRVVLPDNSANSYTLPITFFIEQPSALFLVIVTLALIASALVTTFLARLRTAPPAADPANALPVRAVGRVQRVLMVIGVITVAFVCVVLALELILRFAFATFGTETQRISYLYSREDAREVTGLPLVLPFVQYAPAPGRNGRNSLGYRGDEIAVPKPEGVYRIVALGSSTTYGFTPDGETYPAWLQRILREDYGLTNVEVVNGGVNGYTTWNMLTNFEMRVLELEPDMIIIYEAGNDVLPREVDPDCYRGINMLRGLDPRGYSYTDYSRGTFSASTLYRLLTINLGLEIDPADDAANSIPLRVDCGTGQTLTHAEQVAQNPPVYWQRNLTSVIGVAQAHGVRVLLSTWAYNESTTEPEPYWRQAILDQNQIVRDLADTFDLLFIDFAPIATQEDSAWSDYIHMNSEGSRAQAAAYAAYLVEQTAIPAPGG